MADEGNGERSELEAKLELPTLGLGLRRKRRPKQTPDTVAQEPALEEPAASSVAGHTLEEPATADPVVEAPPAMAPPVVEEPAIEEPAIDASPEPATSLPTAAASARAAQEATTELPERVYAAPPAPALEPEPEPVAVSAAEPTSILPLSPEAEPEPQREPEPEPQAEPAAAATEPAPARRVRRRPRLPARPSLPSLPSLPGLPTVRLSGRVAAVVTGLVVGLTGVLLVYLSEQGCAVVRNTTSCGGAGVVLIVAIFALMVLEGSVLLRAFVVNDALSTSFLGVGVIAVVTMLFLLGVVGHWYMVIVIPLVAAAGFLLAWWVTSQFSNEEPVQREPHLDV